MAAESGHIGKVIIQGSNGNQSVMDGVDVGGWLVVAVADFSGQTIICAAAVLVESVGVQIVTMAECRPAPLGSTADKFLGEVDVQQEGRRFLSDKGVYFFCGEHCGFIVGHGAVYDDGNGQSIDAVHIPL